MSYYQNCKLKCKSIIVVTLLLWNTNSLLAQWQIYVSNDVCMDNSWCLDEKLNKELIVSLMAANLDAMNRTDHEAWQNRARYTCTVTNEVLYFLEKYPERKSELINRIRSGQIMLSPFLVNTNWGFSGSEGFLRSMYPAKRFAAENGLPLTHAVHSELPSLPWDIVPLLSGSGITWINKPYLDFDASFSKLTNPPLFILYGPDSSKINVVLDKHASGKFAYAQASGILKIMPYADKDTSTIEGTWLNYYSKLPNYPLRVILAEGTHSDNSTRSVDEVTYVTNKIIDFNKQKDKPVTFVNATFPMFANLVDSVQNSTPFLPSLKGSLGHTWELWPVGLAKYAASLRMNEYRLIAAESLLASAKINFKNSEKYLNHDRKAEWLLSMFQDHAWNGCDSTNKSTNEIIRKRYAEELLPLIDTMISEGFLANGLQLKPNTYTLYNPINYKRTSFIEIPVKDASINQLTVWKQNQQFPSQIIYRDKGASLCFMSDSVAGYSFQSYSLKPGKPMVVNEKSALKAVLNPENDALNIINESTSLQEASVQFSYVTDNKVFAKLQELKIISDGPVATIYKASGYLPQTQFSVELVFIKANGNLTVSISLDKKPNVLKEALYVHFNLPRKFTQHIETTASVVKPYRIPDGDFLDGADLSRMVMQGFTDAEFIQNDGVRLTSREAFCLNPSDTAFIIELLGNNQNYNEAIRDQNNETHFDFHFSMAFYKGAYSQVQSQAYGALEEMPVLIANGEIRNNELPGISIANPAVKVTAYKPADPVFGDGTILRLWNTSTQTNSVTINIKGYVKAWQTDLLEQDVMPIDIQGNTISVIMKGNGFTGIRLTR